MKYSLSLHARNSLREREIPESWVERVLESPEKLEPDADDPALEHRLGRIAEYGKRVLRVVVNAKENPVRVVTAYFDRRMGKRL